MDDGLRPGLEALGIACETSVPMALRTTLRVGGPADCIAVPRDSAEVAAALRLARGLGMPVFVLGNGSNLLVRDGGIGGLVLHVGGGMARIDREGDCLRAQAGASLARVAQAAQAQGLAGLEAISGIPGTVGGAVCMNAGAYGTEIGDLVTSVQAADETGALQTLPLEALEFGYRKSAVRERRLVVTEVVLALRKDTPEAIAGRMREAARQRREKQPLALPSAGSFFKRPPGQYAAALVDAAGLKGEAVGGAQVSTLHAGFFVNTGGAVAGDFISLMERVQRAVHEKDGVWLTPEVQIIGREAGSLGLCAGNTKEPL